MIDASEFDSDSILAKLNWGLAQTGQLFICWLAADEAGYDW